jgi:hypothetical protein
MEWQPIPDSLERAFRDVEREQRQARQNREFRRDPIPGGNPPRQRSKQFVGHPERTQ